MCTLLFSLMTFYYFIYVGEKMDQTWSRSSISMYVSLSLDFLHKRPSDRLHTRQMYHREPREFQCRVWNCLDEPFSRKIPKKGAKLSACSTHAFSMGTFFFLGTALVYPNLWECIYTQLYSFLLPRHVSQNNSLSSSTVLKKRRPQTSDRL